MRSSRGSLFVAIPLFGLFAACSWNPREPFDREAPAVKQAIGLLADAGDASVAALSIEDYLSTGECKEGNIGTPELVRKRPDGTFDLGLALFRIGESFGRRFGDEMLDAGVTDQQRDHRHAQVECALRLVRAFAEQPNNATDLRAQAHYLEGNLLFLDSEYEDAVKAYDKVLSLTPGVIDGGTSVGRDAAYNRAIALRRIDDDKNKDAGHDAAQPDSGPGDSGGGNGDSGKDDKQDSGSPSSPDSGNDHGPDSGQDGSSNDDNKPDAGEPPPPSDAGGPPPSLSQDDRVLDMLENSAPTVQQEEAKKRAGKRHVKGRADR